MKQLRRVPLLHRLGVGLALLAVALFAWSFRAPLQDAARSLTAAGPQGVAAFVALVALTGPTLLPDSLFGVVAGPSWGPVWGGLVTSLGATLASLLSHALGTSLFRESAGRLVARSARLARLQRALSRGELGLLWLVRALPLNPSTVAYVLASAGVSRRAVLLTSPALVPSHVLVSWLAWLAAQEAAGSPSGTSRWLSWGGLAALVVTLALLVRYTYAALARAEHAGSREELSPREPPLV